MPNQNYLLNVTVTEPGGTFPADGVVYTSPVTTDRRGNFTINNFDLGDFESGIGYRVDIFVTHDPPSGAGNFAPLTALLGGDPLLACIPFWFVTVI